MTVFSWLALTWRTANRRVVLAVSFSLFLVSCGATIEATTSSSVGNKGSVAASTSIAPLVPSGPSAGEVDATIGFLETELVGVDSTALASIDVSAAGISIEVRDGSYDWRVASGGEPLEVAAISDDGSYITGRAGGMLFTRLAVLCEGEQAKEITLVDTKSRAEPDWIAIGDRAVLLLVEATGCRRYVQGANAECLGLPDDPAACQPGDGVGR